MIKILSFLTCFLLLIAFKGTVSVSETQITPTQLEEDTTLIFGIFREMESLDRMMDMANKTDKNTLFYFTGYGDIKGRKMETAFLESVQIQRLLKNDFVCFIGYTDDRISLTNESRIELGISSSFNTKGQYLEELQRNILDTTYQPVFVVLNSSQSILDTFEYSLDKDKFIEFLERNK